MAREKQSSLVIPEIRTRHRDDLIVDFSNFNPTIPSVGVFDEPVRCYTLNKEWAKLFIGFLEILSEPAWWKDANDENYIAIRNLLLFMNGGNCMNCDDIEDCLETSPTIININNTITNNNVSIDIDNSTVTQEFPPSEQSETIGGNVPPDPEMGDCYFDAVWAACVSIVNYIHNNNLDFLQQITQAANLTQQAAKAVSATPLIGLLPFDEILDYIGFLVDELYQEYVATVTTQLLQDVSCDLFCIAIDNDDCGLNFSDLIDYFSAKVAPSLGQGIDTFANLVQFGITGTFSGDDYFYYMCYFQLWVAYTGQEFLSQRGVTQYGLAAAAGYNSPDGDWELFCDECPQGWCYEFDFSISDGGFVQVDATNVGTGQAGGRGIWSVDAWQSSIGEDEFGAPQGGIVICIDTGQQTNLTNVEVEYSKQSTALNWTCNVGMQDAGGGYSQVLSSTQGTAAQNHTIKTAVGDATGQYLRLGWFTANNDPSKICFVHRLKVSGNGTNPFGANNC